jgi:hypothetical protein
MPSDIPSIPPPSGGAYKTTNYLGTCPECGALVQCHYEVPADGPGHVVVHHTWQHAEACSYCEAEP